MLHTFNSNMDDLFSTASSAAGEVRQPLAEQLRPRNINDIIGQQHLLGSTGPIRAMVQTGKLQSIILWGPPGSGKTTLAQCITRSVNASFAEVRAIDSGVKELRSVLQKAQFDRIRGVATVLFVDETHRFNKLQQDALLHAVEQGHVVFIGATTENPSFSVNNALLSRCHVYRLNPLSPDDMHQIISRAAATVSTQSGKEILVDSDVLVSVAGGDARTLLNILESAVNMNLHRQSSAIVIDKAVVEQVIQQRVARYDGTGDDHYQLISALIKSIRGSDPDAALLYLAAMIDGGEDPLFIARRLVILSAEDIGNADPQALVLAMACLQAIEKIGMPEGRLLLAQVTTYLASAPKSNASYLAIDAAMELVRLKTVAVPLHLRNASTELMKSEGYGKGYRYPHSYPGHVVSENYFPSSIKETLLYKPDGLGAEDAIQKRLRQYWPNRWSPEEE
ncbi:MAG: Replication-associated recombination protein A [Chlorobi bacterium]|nr:MAG: AAA ATPase central domain protein [Chlorobi bacterium OLB6]MBV6464129.1 Replication-associated recombination protein A [Chlorobiota bacterium]